MEESWQTAQGKIEGEGQGVGKEYRLTDIPGSLSETLRGLQLHAIYNKTVDEFLTQPILSDISACN